MTTSNADPVLTGVAAEVAELRARVGQLAETLWAARPAEELVDVVVEVGALSAQLGALVLDVAEELEATGGAKSRGWVSTRDLVTHAEGGPRGHGPRTARLVRSTSADGPGAPVRAAMREGWLSRDKAGIITSALERLPFDRATRERGVEVMLDAARTLDATDLRTVGARLVSVVDPEAEQRRHERELAREERAAHHGRFLSITDDGMGGVWIKGRAGVEDGELLRATLLSLAAPQPTDPSRGSGCDRATCEVLGCTHDGSDPRDHGTRLLDALVEACRRLQTAQVLPTAHAAAPRLTVTIPLADLTDGLTAAGHEVTTETGLAMPVHLLRRLACDAEVIPAVLGSSSEVLDVGRSERLVTPPIWRALVARDRHCTFPGCRRPPVMCIAHHVRHWAEGGSTSLSNLALLCHGHHRVIHSQPWAVETSDTGPRYTPPEGVRVLAA